VVCDCHWNENVVVEIFGLLHNFLLVMMSSECLWILSLNFWRARIQIWWKTRKTWKVCDYHCKVVSSHGDLYGFNKAVVWNWNADEFHLFTAWNQICMNSIIFTSYLFINLFKYIGSIGKVTPSWSV
jgi:hypothetical protein